MLLGMAGGIIIVVMIVVIIVVIIRRHYRHYCRRYRHYCRHYCHYSSLSSSLFLAIIVVSILRRHGERESQQSSSLNTNCGNFTIRDPVREWSVSFQNRASVCR